MLILAVKEGLDPQAMLIPNLGFNPKLTLNNHNSCKGLRRHGIIILSSPHLSTGDGLLTVESLCQVVCSIQELVSPKFYWTVHFLCLSCSAIQT